MELGLPWWLGSKESACNAVDMGLIPWVAEIPWRRKWQPTPVFLPGESHGLRGLDGYSPWGRKESDMIEQLSTHTRKNLKEEVSVHLSGRGFLWWSHFKRKGTQNLRKTSRRKDEQADAEKKQRSAVPQVLSDSRDRQQGLLNVMCPQVVTPCGGCGGGRWNSPPRC